jgi:hypothetical protein
LEYLAHRKAQIFVRWDREDEAEDFIQLSRDSSDFFKQPPYRITGVKRSPPPPASPAPEEVPWHRPEVALPPAPSPWLQRQLSIPANERLPCVRAPPEAPAPPGRSVRLAEWQEFIRRQVACENEKRRCEWQSQKRPCKTVDGPVYEKLFKQSLIDRHPPPSLLPPRPRHRTFSPNSQAIVRKYLSVMKTESRSLGENESQPEVVPQNGRDTRFSPASQELTRDKPPLKERIAQSCDLRAVLEDERVRQKEAKERKLFYEQQDE